MNNAHWEILDDKRRKLVEKLSVFIEDYYLAGGTALALQLGHRRSIDFDFFAKKEVDKISVEKRVHEVFVNSDYSKIQDEDRTLSFMIEDVKVSFFGYPYPVIKELISLDIIDLASIEDIGCMKLSAIVSRSTMKDYVDLYFIIKNLGLRKLLSFVETKYPNLDINLVLKSLIYFGDIDDVPIDFMADYNVDMSEIKKYLIQEVEKIGVY